MGWTPSSVLSSGLPFPTTASEQAEFTEYFAYDDLGRQTLHLSFEGVVEQLVYDSATGRLSEQRFFPSLTAYSNGQGTPSEIWSFQFDAFGRQTAVTQTVGWDSIPTNLQSRTTQTQYDVQGRVARITSPEGIVAYGYDALGRKTKMETLSPSVLASTGSVSQAVLESTAYGYDTLGRLQTVTVTRRLGVALSSPEVTRYSYDLLGNLVRQDMPNGVITVYTYDRLNRLDTLTHYRSTGGSPVSDLDMSDNPKIAEFDYTVRADGQRTRLDEKFWVDADQTPDIENTYRWTYDGLERLVDEVFETNLDDLVNGLESLGLEDAASLPSSSRAGRDYHDHYTFDLTGNRLSKSTDEDLDGIADRWVDSTYDANDRLRVERQFINTLQGLPGPMPVSERTDYAYDHTQQIDKSVYRGDPPTVSNRLSSLQFQYDLQGRLEISTSTTYSPTDGTQVLTQQRTTYDYDTTGIRVTALTETDNNGDSVFDTRVKTEWLNDPQNFTGYSQVIRETHTTLGDGTNPDRLDKTVIYTFGLDEISQTTATPQPDGSVSSTTHTFLHDGHGSVRALLDAAQALARVSIAPSAPAILQLFTFDAYGNAIAFRESSAATALLYSGEQFDQRVMMQYLRARYYDGANGRFVGLDPFAGSLSNPQSFHKFAYTHSNPILGVDPSGNEFTIQGIMSNISVSVRMTTNALNAVQKVYKIVNTINDVLTMLDYVGRVAKLLQLLGAGGGSGAAGFIGTVQAALQAAFNVNPSDLNGFIPGLQGAFGFIANQWDSLRSRILDSADDVAAKVASNLSLQQTVASHGLTGKGVGLVINLPSPPKMPSGLPQVPWAGIKPIQIKLPKGFTLYLRSANERGRLFAIEARAGGKKNPTWINIVRYDYQDFQGGTLGYLPHYHIADDPTHYSL